MMALKSASADSNRSLSVFCVASASVCALLKKSERYEGTRQEHGFIHGD